MRNAFVIDANYSVILQTLFSRSHLSKHLALALLIRPVGRSPLTHRNRVVAEEPPYFGILVPCKTLREEVPVGLIPHQIVPSGWHQCDIRRRRRPAVMQSQASRQYAQVAPAQESAGAFRLAVSGTSHLARSTRASCAAVDAHRVSRRVI